MTSPYQGGGGYGPPPGDAWYGPGYQPDLQAWDPSYPHPAPVPPGWGYPPPGRPPYPSAPPAPARNSRGLVGAVIVLSLALVAALAVIVSGVTRSTGGTAVASGSSGVGSGSAGTSGGSSGGSSSGGSSGGSQPSTPGSGNSGFPFPSAGRSASSGKATSAQQVGVVDIDTVQKYNAAAAAGTGIILSSTGEVLTNNHVIEGSTSIRVRVVSTGKTYVAKVVGTAPSKDVAVLRLVDATGLQTANLGDSGTLSTGDSVVGVGNAGGVGGIPSAAAGKVTALHRSITASDESGSNSERLHDIIVMNAPIRSGDSGGPLYDANGRVVGMDTAASTNGTNTGFAIPIDDALGLAHQIEKGIETSSIHIGYPGFLGVTVTPSSGSGALVQGVLGGGPAAKAGIVGGDVITRVNSTAITSSTQLHNLMSKSQPGSSVSVTYTDRTRRQHTASVTLVTGPAD